MTYSQLILQSGICSETKVEAVANMMAQAVKDGAVVQAYAGHMATVCDKLRSFEKRSLPKKTICAVSSTLW